MTPILKRPKKTEKGTPNRPSIMGAIIKSLSKNIGSDVDIKTPLKTVKKVQDLKYKTYEDYEPDKGEETLYSRKSYGRGTKTRGSLMKRGK